MMTAKEACWKIGISSLPGELKLMAEIQQDAYEAGLKFGNPCCEPLKQKIPLVLYFADQVEADEFKDAVLRNNPNLRQFRSET